MSYFKEYHPLSERLTDILCSKTQNNERLFFRVLLAYYWGVIASQMRCNITGFGGKSGIPINIYALNTSPSGTGKGFSTSLMETEVLNLFKQIFYEHTFPITATLNLEKLAQNKANKNNTLYDDEIVKYEREFFNLGSPLFTFDSATTPAVKQLRQKLLMANTGSLNLQVDEIGANLLSQKEVLTTFLELYDKGLVKEKLIKSSKDDVRFEKIEGSTPANMLLFGTPSKLLDGGLTEQHLYEMLEMGYARRCLFGFVTEAKRNKQLTAQEVYKRMFDNDNDDFLELVATQLADLADISHNAKSIALPEPVCLKLIEYRIQCEELARSYKEHESILKSELEHRYFKALKLAGAYAFVDGKLEIDAKHLDYAITLVEDSGEAFAKLMTPERPYVKLAKYLANNDDLTLADLDEDLPYFRGSKQQKEELITLATAWGYKNNVIIKKSFTEGIQFLRGETLKETNLDELILSYSKDMTTGYENKVVPFGALCDLAKMPNRHWLNHHLANGDTGEGYRKEENCLQGFNLLVLDVDGTCSLSTVQMMLSKYTAFYYTTKSHTSEVNRFRIILPMNYHLKLDAQEYKEFFNSILETLPFEVDTSCNHRSKKWLTNANTQCIVNEGELFDVLPFIPKTSKNEERQQTVYDQQNLDNLERWVLNNIGDGNRNNQLHRYAMILFDAGLDLPDIMAKVQELNEKIPDKLGVDELNKTIFSTVSKKFLAK